MDDSLKIRDRELGDRSEACIAGIEVKLVTEELPKDVNKLGPKINIYKYCQANTNYCCCKFII